MRSGHKIGKSTAAAIVALWWVYTRPDSGVVFTAPTARQVKRIVWKELRRLVRNARIKFPKPARDPATGLEWDDGRFIYGFSTDEPERFAGISGPALLFIVDEASGVEEEIYEAIEGNRAGGAKLALFSNPTRPSGTFADAFGERRAGWHVLHISSEDSPNVTGECHIPGLATKDWVDEKREEWGENSPLYQVRVRGNFAAANADCAIPLWLVHTAIDRWAPEDFERNGRDERLGRLEAGLDVARFGDDESVLFVRRGDVQVGMAWCNGFDNPEVAAMARDELVPLRQPGEPRPRVKVDTSGEGAGVAAILRTMRDENGDPLFDVVDVRAGDKANREDEYPNIRSELWFGMADWLRTAAIVDDARLTQELVTPKFSFDERSRRVVEKKKDFKARLGRSPDRADAACLSVWNTSGTTVRKAKRPTQSSLRFGAQRGYG